MARYRKRPLEVEAVPAWEVLQAVTGTWEHLPPWVRTAYDRGDIIFYNQCLSIRTLERFVLAERDDWLIHGVVGELYPIKPQVFRITYELVRE